MTAAKMLKKIWCSVGFISFIIYGDYKIKICTLLISFWSSTGNEKNFELKKVIEYF